ncbi:hypothetical protein [Enterococcus sp. AZ103]
MKKIVALLMVLFTGFIGFSSIANASDSYSYKDRVYETPEKKI